MKNHKKEYEREETKAQEEGFIQTIEDYGVEVYELTPEQLAEFQEQTRRGRVCKRNWTGSNR